MAKLFGVEIECFGDHTIAMRALIEAGFDVHDLRRTHEGNHRSKWTVKRDGSIDPGTDRGVEVCSPPLDFNDPEQRAQVSKVVDVLRAAGLETHRGAGVHVHIDAKHEDGRVMTHKELAAVVRFTYKFEDAMYRIASAGWQTIRDGIHSYAMPIPEHTARAVMHITDEEDLWEVWEGSVAWMQRHRSNRRTASLILEEMERYTATNLHAFKVHGTVEFRYFNSTLNPARIQAYIALCMAIMDDARNGFSRSVKKSYRLGAMFNGEIDEKAMMMRLQQIFRSNSRDTKVCMSEEDWKNLRRVAWRMSHPQRPFNARRPTDADEPFAARARRIANHVTEAGEALQGLSEATQATTRSVAALR